MNFTNYENKVEYPGKPKKPVEPKYHGDSVQYEKDSQAFVLALKQYTIELEKYHAALKLYREESNRLERLFKIEALEEVGLSDHPKADKIFAYAWEQGHAYGYSEVFIHLRDIAELFKD